MNVQSPIQTIYRKSLHEQLVERLQDLIVEGVLAPGEKFPEKDLCAQFGVSRTPMREALKVLAADGLIVLEPNRGAWISSITIEELRELFPVLAALEALSGELACANILDEEIAEIRMYHDEMVRHFDDRNRMEYFRTNQKIHHAIIKAAGNATLEAQHHALAARVRRARYTANISEDRWKQAVEEHEIIIHALEARDAVRLSDILKRHLQNKFETVRRQLEIAGG